METLSIVIVLASMQVYNRLAKKDTIKHIKIKKERGTYVKKHVFNHLF